MTMNNFTKYRLSRETDRPMYERARLAGEAAHESALEQNRVLSDERCQSAFICFASSAYPGLEAAWRQFAVGYDERNRTWAFGNND